MATVKFIHNATLIYTSRGGFRILCDPWYTPGAFLTWTHVYDVGQPPRFNDDFDALYLSHAHEDHFDETFLQTLPRSTPIILPNEPVIPIMANKLKALGFERLIICNDGEKMQIGDIDFKVYGPYQRSRFNDDGNFPNILDSSIFFNDGDSTFLNTNDNFPTKSALNDFSAVNGKINCISVLYNSAGFYPHCVRNLTEAEKVLESERVIRHCEDLIVRLNLTEHCDYIFPIAGDFCLEGPSTKANKFLPVSSPDEFSSRITQLQNIKVVSPGGFGRFEVKTGDVLQPGVKYKVSDIRNHFVDKPTEKYNIAFSDVQIRYPIDSVALKDRFNARLLKFNSHLPYNFQVIDERSNEVLFSYDNNKPHEIKIFLEEKLFFALINKKIHWQNAWLGGLMTFWRSDHPHYNKDFYDLLSFLHY